jgi:hypothetical protein
MTSPPTNPPNPETVAKLIRGSMFVGPMLLGAVTYFLHRQPGYVPVEGWKGLQLMIGGAMLAGLAIVFVARTLLARAVTAQEAMTRQLIGWAAGEFAALAGGVYYFLTDDPRLFIVGMIILLASFILVPLRRDATRYQP